MDTFVSARVPVEVKSQAGKMLAEQGFTHSDLVNAAYTFFLKTGHLPSSAQEKTGMRHLTDEQAGLISARLDETTFTIPEETWEGKDYKKLVSEWRLADYEALA